MKIVVSLGGNSLLLRGDQPTAERVKLNIMHAAHILYRLVAMGHDLIITHACGPQIDLAAQQPEDSDNCTPLDVVVAESNGMIGYYLKQELDNNIKGSPRVVNLTTSVEVDPNDPEFKSPTKQIGHLLTREEAMVLFESWMPVPESIHCRRLVPSPKPVSVPDLSVIKLLAEHNIVVVCAGGGGIPVVQKYDGDWKGVEAVIDKDRTASLLASLLKADMLLLLTDVAAVYRDFGTDDEEPIKQISSQEISQIEFPMDSMGTKVEAACDFVNNANGVAGIGALEDALQIVEQKSGTIITGE